MKSKINYTNAHTNERKWRTTWCVRSAHPHPSPACFSVTMGIFFQNLYKFGRFKYRIYSLNVALWILYLLSVNSKFINVDRINVYIIMKQIFVGFFQVVIFYIHCTTWNNNVFFLIFMQNWTFFSLWKFVWSERERERFWCICAGNKNYLKIVACISLLFWLHWFLL